MIIGNPINDPIYEDFIDGITYDHGIMRTSLFFDFIELH